MKISVFYYTLLLQFCICLLLTFSSCSKKDSLPIPEIPQVVFIDANTVELSFVSSLDETEKMNVLATDLQGNTFEFNGFTESPFQLSNLSAGNVYTFQLQLQQEENQSDFSPKSPPFLASIKQDTNFNRIDMLQQINEARQSARSCGSKSMPAVEPLVWNDLLEDASKIHSIAMDEQNFFGHSNPITMEQLDGRLQKVNYPFGLAYENIAQGYPTLQQTMDAWLISEPHCKNLMNANIKEVGAFKHGKYWTQVLALR